MGLIRSAGFGLLLVAASCLSAQVTSPAAIQEVLAAHNQARAKVGVPPLKWSGKLAAVAQEWAEELANSGKFVHRPKNQFGENLYEQRGGRASAAEAVGSWAAEAKDYDAMSGGCRTGAMCGHYTQLVWRNTKQVGCGVARVPDFEVWVCNYDPPGNWVGQRPY